MKQLTHREITNPQRSFPLWLVCPDWRDPLNVGSAFRLADAAGLAGIILAGTSPTPPHSRIAKTARSTERSVNWNAEEDLKGFLGVARNAGALVLALEITDTSKSLFEFQLPITHEITLDRPVYLIAGNESAGVAQELLDLCDGSVHLPMYGQNTSMNVSVALGAAVYLLLQQLAK